MANPWKKRLATVSVWVAAEMLLNVVGLDNIADYGEFLLHEANMTNVMEVIQQVVNSMS